MSRRPLLVLCAVPALALSAAPAALAGEDTPTVTEPAPPPVTVTVPSPPPPPPPPVTVTVPSPPPPPVTVTVPAPAPAPAPESEDTSPSKPKSSPSAPKKKSAPKSSERPHVKAVQIHSAPVRTQPVARPVSLTAAAPAGGVQAGGGGMASGRQRSDWPAFALGGASLLLLVLGGRLVLSPRGRRR